MNEAVQGVRNYCSDAVRGWNQFWFTPRDPGLLSLIRICAGGMLFYTHLVWSLRFLDFFGPDSWISRELVEKVTAGDDGFPITWLSKIWWVDSPGLLWAIHLGALLVFFCLTIGFCSRTMSVLAYLLAISYTGRVPIALFGLDKINCMLALYLIVGPCGAYYSVDRWLKLRRHPDAPPPAPSTSANIAIRLIQLHMCIIYLFSGLGKLRGETWWDGTAVWQAAANLEYQSIPATWLAAWPRLVGLMTHLTIFFELFYPVLIWNRYTRPLLLALAVALHGGIGMFLGMITFGTIMIVGNFAFLPDSLIHRICDPIFERGRSASQKEMVPDGATP